MTLKTIHIKELDITTMAEELGKLEERKPHDAVKRLLRKSLRAKIARLKKKGK